MAHAVQFRNTSAESCMSKRFEGQVAIVTGMAHAVQFRNTSAESCMSKRFEGQVAIVTGAACGIGRATAIAFASEGARVVAADVVDDMGEDLIGVIRRNGGIARYVHCDITQPAQVRALVVGTVNAWGRVDCAFNNAGVEGTQASVDELPEAAWRRVIEVNLTGQFLCMQEELRQMVKQGGGAIVNNASILGTVGFAGAGAYVAAKHGLLGLTKVAALEYAARGVRVNAVCPGFVVTPMLERAGLLSKPEVRAQLESLHAVKRLGRADEIAEAVLFLCSPQASFIAGHPLLVDGGFVAQ
jgi:NAD(P)-dependent dehydrogenase (short-subunit alcohol dehydrogenase family)